MALAKRGCLNRDICAKAVLSLVISRVDYYNSLLVGESAAALREVQLHQNYAARLVMGLHWRDHVTPALQAVHRLPIHQRVCYKLMCLLYKTLYSDDAPTCMDSMVSLYTPGGHWALPAPLRVYAWLYLALVWLVRAAAPRCQL